MKKRVQYLPLIILFFILTGCGLRGSSEAAATSTPTSTPEQGPAVFPTVTNTPSPIPISTLELPERTAVIATPTDPAEAESSDEDESCPTPPGWINYTVQFGNTLFSLAQATESTVEEIMAGNCLPDTRIIAGQPLFLAKAPVVPMATPTGTPTATPEEGPATVPTATLTPTATPEEGPATGPGDPILNIMPVSGPIPTTYTAVLENFDPNETVSIQLFFTQDNSLVLTSSIIVDGEGNGSFVFSSEENDQPGIYLLLAVGEGGAPELFGNFRIGE